MKSALRRELVWICLPLVLLVGAVAWISHDQNERNAEKRRRESGPLRVHIWSIQLMPGDVDGKYKYGSRVEGRVEGFASILPPGKVWVLRVKSASISDGKAFKKVRVLNAIDPLDGDNPLQTDVLGVADADNSRREAREIGLWIYCDSALVNPTLEVELEAVEGIVTPRPGKKWLSAFTASGARVAAPTEKIPLRTWNQNNDKRNIIKSE